MANFKLQLLHFSDQEAGIPALEDAPRLSAVLNALKNQDGSDAGTAPDFPNTLILSSGDAYIPGAFLNASQQAFGGQGRADILIQNELGVQAITFGNHEFDLGTSLVANLLKPGAAIPATGTSPAYPAYTGALFPYLSGNLNFAPDANLAPLVTADGQEASTIPGKITGSTIITVNGQKIGVVGATTPTLRNISSPGSVGVDPTPFGGSPSGAELDVLAALIQTDVDALLAANPSINKVILMAHMQQIAIEKELATRLKNVDIIMAGGSNTRLFDSNDVLRPGDTNQGTYPTFSTDANGKPIAVINTDGNYKYVGRLVVDFDDNGNLLPSSYDANVSGAYATDATGVAALGAQALVDPEVQTIVNQLKTVVAAQDGAIFGHADVFLNGTRSDVRTQETNFGNLSADANLAIGQGIDPTVTISIKNGGGIRDNIGVVTFPTGGTNASDALKLPTAANPLANKAAGDISQLDITNSLRFNNGLTLVTLTAEQLLQVIEHSVAGTAPGATPGQFGQFGGVKFSFDPSRPAGDRVVSLAVVSDQPGAVPQVIAQNGAVVGNPDRTFRIVTLNFLASGGDNYPFPAFQTANPTRFNRVDLLGEQDTNGNGFEAIEDLNGNGKQDAALVEPTKFGKASFASFGSEQDALAEYLVQNFPNAAKPFNQADTGAAQDVRIQNLAVTQDTVLAINGSAGKDTLLASSGKSNETLLGLAGNDYLDALPGAGNNTLKGGDGDDELYGNKTDRLLGEAGNDVLTSDGSGNNTLEGGEGNDKLYADQNDVVIGDAGDDIIFGGLGGNTLTGGQGKDVFWVAVADAPATANIVSDFNQNSDTIRINLAGVTKFSDLSIAKSGENDASISFNGNQLALVKNTVVGSLNTNTVVVDINAPNNIGNNVVNYDFTNLPELGTTSQGQKISLGGFSGLFFQGVAANGNLKFLTHTDRGPNGENNGAKRPFALPNFQPELVQFELNQSTGAINITKRTGLFGFDGTTPLTGLPNLQAGDRGTAYTDEIPVDLQGNQLSNNPLGADLEGVVVDPDGNYWMVDEYRPAIYQFDANGKLLDRFIPQGTATAPTPDQPAGTFGKEVLPAVYAQRRNNRGFEAVAREGNKLYAFMQSAIDNPDTTGDTTSRASRNLRILEFDIVTKKVTGEYLYLLEGLAGTDKIGDAVSLGKGKFAVVERDDNGTANGNKLIFNIDLKNATNINNPANFTLPTGKTIEQLTTDELLAANIKVVSKNLIVNAAQAGYTGIEKLEGLALVDANTLALLNDNDFGIRSTTNNPNGSVTLSIENVPSRLGLLKLNQPLSLKPSLNQVKSTDGNGLLLLDGRGDTALTVRKVSRQTNARNEVGVFEVDDNKGTINGFKPGDNGYIAEVFKRSKVIFASLDSGPINSLLDAQGSRSLNLTGNRNLGFYLIGEGTADEIRSGGSTANVIFSFPTGNSGVPNAQVTENNGVIEVAWEESKGGGDRDFNDLVIQIETATNPAPLGTNQQSIREIFDLTGITTPVQASFELKRDAAYNNRVGFYKVEDALGTIKVGNLLIKPGEDGYRKAAVDNRIAGIDLSAANGQTLTSTGTLQGGSLYVPFLIANATAPDATYSNVYTAYSLGNADRADHIRLLADNTFGFEDLVGGGDRDFNDVIVKATFTL